MDATLKAVNKDPEDEPPLEVVAALYSDKAAGEAELVGGRWRWQIRSCRPRG